MIVGTVNVDYVIFVLDEKGKYSQEIIDQMSESLYLEAKLRLRGVNVDDYDNPYDR